MNPNPASSQSFRAIDVIRKKRDGVELSRSEIESLVDAYTRGQNSRLSSLRVADGSCSAGNDAPETAALTDAMLRSGEVLDLSSLAGEESG